MRLPDLALRAYLALPGPMRSAAATARGYYLRAWRQGGDSARLVAEAIERERWSEARWQEWRADRLAFVLHRAATRVPYYKAHWAERRRRGDHGAWDLLPNWPVLEKEALREQPEAFVADDRERRWMFHEHSSGTTGASLDLWRSRDTVRAWYALNEARWRGWYGVSERDRWAMFGGQLVAAATQEMPPFWVWNTALQQLYCSAYHLSPSTAASYVSELARRKVRYALGYTSALHALAVEINAQRLPMMPLSVVITNAEPVYPNQRESISRAFGCSVRETYGLAEMVTAAGECEHGAMHLWPEVGVVEILEGDSAVAAGDSGDLVGTGLMNADMPLVRYRIGDRGALAAHDALCACGRTMPRMARMEGRSDDVLYTRSGRVIGRLDPVFKADLFVREAQIIQESLDRVRVRFAPADGFNAIDAREISERIQERMGDVHVILEPVSAVPREANGKFRAVICALPEEERAVVRRS